MLAPVLSQPSLPTVGAKRKADLGPSDADLMAVRDRVDSDDICVLGPALHRRQAGPAGAGSSRCSRELGENFIGVEIDRRRATRGATAAWRTSVLAEDLVDEPGQPTHEALGRCSSSCGDRPWRPLADGSRVAPGAPGRPTAGRPGRVDQAARPRGRACPSG